MFEYVYIRVCMCVCELLFQKFYVVPARMFTWKYEDLKYERSETRYADYGITRKKSGVERSRIFGKAVYVTPLQTHFRLPCWPTSDKPLRKQTFRQYRSPLPAFRFFSGTRARERERPLLSIPGSRGATPLAISLQYC